MFLCPICFIIIRIINMIKIAGPIGREVYGVGLRPLACWDCGFECRRGHGCLSVVCVVCCQVEVSALRYHSSRGVLPTVLGPISVLKKPQEWGGHDPRWAAASRVGGGGFKIWLTNPVGYRNSWTKLTNQQWKGTPYIILRLKIEYS